MLGSVKIGGDPTGVDGLKALAQKDREYLKFLINEARSNTDLKTTFKTHAGQPFVLRLDPASGDLIVEKPAQGH